MPQQRISLGEIPKRLRNVTERWASDDTSLTFLGSYSKDKIGPPRTCLPIQGTLLDNPNGDLARNSYLDGVGLENTNEQTNLGLEFNHLFTDVWSLEARVRYTRNERLRREPAAAGWPRLDGA